MRYLGLALVAEGPSDYRFLPSLLHRLTEDLCLQHGRAPVDIAPVVALTLDTSPAGDRAARIASAARHARGGFHVLFLHTDADSDAEAARRDRFAVWRDAVVAAGVVNERTVAVVPVREMEAWTLCDGDALRAAFGSSLSDRELDLPDRPDSVERLQDPKRILQAAYERACTPRARRRSAANVLEAIAQRVRLERLRQVPALQRLEHDLHAALRELRFVT